MPPGKARERRVRRRGKVGRGLESGRARHDDEVGNRPGCAVAAAVVLEGKAADGIRRDIDAGRKIPLALEVRIVARVERGAVRRNEREAAVLRRRGADVEGDAADGCAEVGRPGEAVRLLERHVGLEVFVGGAVGHQSGDGPAVRLAGSAGGEGRQVDAVRGFVHHRLRVRTGSGAGEGGEQGAG